MRGWILHNKKQADLTKEADDKIVKLLEAAKSHNMELSVYRPDQFDLVVSNTDERTILIDGKHTDLPDFMMPLLGALTTYFASTIIRQMEYMGVPCINSSRAIEIARDKLHMHQIFAASNLPTPKTMIAKFPITTKVVREEIGFPVVVKNVSGMRGAGVYLSETEDRFKDLMDFIQEHNSNANIILQEYVEKSRGKDLRVFVLGGRVLGCMQRSSETSFKANISRGGGAKAFELTPEIEWLATETARLIGLDMAGIDLLFAENGFKICEANSAPGFKGIEGATGINVADQVLDYINIKLGALT